MKLTATIKLQPSDDQRQLLYQTLERANAGCNSISETAWQAKRFGRASVHRLTYGNLRAEFDLTAQLAIRCMGKVVDAYKKDKGTKRLFKKLGAVAYDERILNFRLKDSAVSIWVLGGRAIIPFMTGEHQRALLPYQRGESDLVHRKGEFYLYTTCDVPDDAPIDPEGWLGVDLGIANIATDSDGEQFAANHLLSVRHRYHRMRKKLQSKGTHQAKRRLKQWSGREARFRNDVNHQISKRIVRKAQDTRRGIALEDLEGIRQRVTVRKPQRRTLHSWSFHDLRMKIAYKAEHSGIPLVLIDPAYTSQRCSVCGYVDRGNRPNQAAFKCLLCGHADHADRNAAVNISRAAFNPPNIPTDPTASASGTISRL
jgi:IS605 OrfB family transposase